MFSYPFLVPMRKRFVLSDEVNVAILRVVQSGYMQKWIREVKNYDYVDDLKVQERDTSTRHIPLRLGDLLPVFAIWLVGVCVSFCVFLGECWVHRMS